MAIELLAPAGNIDIARSAIMSGADAIYIGPSAFGARQAASNSMDDIARLLDYAHLFDVKIYLTMNTILYDDELEKAYNIAHKAEEIGVDALIVQDMAYQMMGLNRIPLHASTQTFNFDKERAKLVAASGFDRIVLERSFTLSEIKDIRKTIPDNIELECFIHGAMCVGYSGRCYLSEFLCGRSGNRGVCSQACRSQYDLYSEDGKLIDKSASVLSVSDLNLSSRVKDLINAGVCSLKVEGRLKDESYVVNNISYYNNLLNSYGVERTSKGNVSCMFSPNPRKSFSRGFNGYMFLDNPRAKVGAPTKSLGEQIGIIDMIDGNAVRLDVKVLDLHNGDGVSWVVKSRQYGAYVNGVTNKGIILSSVGSLRAGDKIYRNLDKSFRPTQKDVERKLPISIVVSGDNKQIVLSVQGFSKCFDYSYSEAKNPELSCNTIIQSLSKTGNSPYDVLSVDVNLAQIPFLPVSVLNSMRREFFDEYSKFLISNYKLNIRKENLYSSDTQNCSLRFPSSLTFEWNVSNRLAQKFYHEHGVEEIEPALELQDNIIGKEIMHSRHCIRRQYNLCPKDNHSIKAATPLILENNGKRIKAVFDCKNCQMKLSAL